MAHDDQNAWPFDQSPSCATFVTKGLLENRNPILFVSHDEDDHGWQFHDTLDAKLEDARIVCLSHILDIDPSMRLLADLKPGWVAWREDVTSQWKRAKNPPHVEDD